MMFIIEQGYYCQSTLSKKHLCFLGEAKSYHYVKFHFKCVLICSDKYLGNISDIVPHFYATYLK